MNREPIFVFFVTTDGMSESLYYHIYKIFLASRKTLAKNQSEYEMILPNPVETLVKRSNNKNISIKKK